MMKQILLIAVVLNLIFLTEAKSQLTKKPEPLPASTFSFPEYAIFELNNGLKIFIIEDNEQPVVSIRFLAKGGKLAENGKTGISGLTVSLLAKGAGDRSAEEIAAAIDGVGASLNAGANNDYCFYEMTFLKKHSNKMLPLLADIIIKPDFPDDEFDKLISREITEIHYDKSNSGTLARRLSGMAVYGDEHPYAKYPDIETIEDLEVEDAEEFYHRTFTASNSSIAIIGDVDKDNALELLETLFADMEVQEETQEKISGNKSGPPGVYYIRRPGSVQSSVVVSAEAVPYSAPDFYKHQILSKLIGGGFGSRLFKTLRETYSFTYSPYGYLTKSKYPGRYVFGAEVNAAKTDSSVLIILEQLEEISTAPPEEKELTRTKSELRGSFMMDLENSEFIASLIQNADFYGIDMAAIQRYPKFVMGVKGRELQRIAKQYLSSHNLRIAVVGNPEIEKELEKYGNIYEYNMDLEPLTGPMSELKEVDLDAEELLSEYRDAIGGSALNKINNIKASGDITMLAGGERLTGKVIEIRTNKNQYYEMVDLTQFKQEKWVDGKSAWIMSAGTLREKKGQDLEDALLDANLFKTVRLIELGYKCEVLGKSGEKILMRTVSPDGELTSTYYFDSNSYLLNKIEKTEMGPDGPVPVIQKYLDYGAFENVKLPKQIIKSNPMFELKMELTYKMNLPVQDTVFHPEK